MNRFVLGSIGPTAAGLPGAAAEQAGILAGEGVNALLLETFRFPEVEAVLEEVRTAAPAGLPVFVSLWQWPDPPEPAARRLVERGPRSSGSTARTARPPRWRSPSAGAIRDRSSARQAGSRRPGTAADHSMTPEDLAAAVPALLARNVRLIGGCCGTDERHVLAVALSLRIHRVSFGYAKGEARR